jgi:hypothetical protein
MSTVRRLKFLPGANAPATRCTLALLCARGIDPRATLTAPSALLVGTVSHQQAEDAPVVVGVDQETISIFSVINSLMVFAARLRAPQELHAIHSGHQQVSNNGGIGTAVA